MRLGTSFATATSRLCRNLVLDPVVVRPLVEPSVSVSCPLMMAIFMPASRT